MSDQQVDPQLASAALSAPTATQKPPKSPPLAFEPTPNDVLMPLSRGPATMPFYQQSMMTPGSIMSPPIDKIQDTTVSFDSNSDMDILLAKKDEALRLALQAFTVERECWQMEKDHLHRRIANLEALLKASVDGHSPARSPIISPSSGYTTTSPPPCRSSGVSSRLASIAEDEATAPLSGTGRARASSLKRESAPVHIELPPAPKLGADGQVEIDPDVITEIRAEMPPSPPATRATLSPPPAANRHLAGHTPIKLPARPVDFSPSRASSVSERLSDTPTRANTQLNALLSEGSEDDKPLKGPLNMPGLPNNPGAENFTMEMLDARLKDVEDHPEENQPLVLQVPSPGVYVAERGDHIGAKAGASADQAGRGDAKSESTSKASSKARSPGPLTDDEEVPSLDQGIRLRKRPSVNFGAPLGQLGFRKL